MTFSGNRLRAIRDHRSLSRPALAARLKMSSESVAGWEAGRYVPSPQSLVALAFALRVAPEDFERTHDDPVRDYVAAILPNDPPPTDEALDAAARILRLTSIGRRSEREPPAA